MTATEKWSGRVNLPAIEMPRKKIGANCVTQFAFGGTGVDAQIFESEFPSYDLLRTPLDTPFQDILIRRKRCRKTDPEGYMVIYYNDTTYDSLNEESTLSWEVVLPSVLQYNTPQAILESWRDQFKFKEESATGNIFGLRPPQLGALHAICSHFFADKIDEPATVVLPTGTGKTEVMLSHLTYNRCEKLLVLVPSDALRKQIASKFCSLGILPSTGILPTGVALPRTTLLQKGIKTKEEAEKIIEESNVIITTPYILSHSTPDVFNTICAKTTDLIIDEAHHASASTWNLIRKNFVTGRIIQFTATPYRNDGKHIGGKIIFNYSLGAAQKAGYYKKIRLNTIEEYDAENKDTKIAEAALEILKKDISNGLNHILMARTDTISKAKSLYQKYCSLAPEFSPVLVYTGAGRKTANNDALTKMISGDSRVVVCVNMLGEGFDLPALKIAAIHDGHKSLTVTLQFIGRFTRRSGQDTIGDAAAVVNIAESDTENNLQKLYSQDANWDELIKRFSEDNIERELRLEEVVESLKKSGDLHAQISLWNLHPTLTTQMYKTTCLDWSPLAYEDVLPKSIISHWHSISEEKKILVVVGIQSQPAGWVAHQNLQDITHKLFIAYWNKEKKALFVYANDYDSFRSEKLVEAITQNSAEKVTGPVVFNVLNNVELPLAKNLGTSKVGAISFTSYFGLNVTEGLSTIEKRESVLNNIACMGYENGERVIWAASKKKGKIWSVRSASIYEWLDWCNKTWEKVDTTKTDEANIIRDFLKPEKMPKHYNQPAISAQWGEYTQSKIADSFYIMFGPTEQLLYQTDIEIRNVGTTGKIEIAICSDHCESIYEFEINKEFQGGYRYKLVSGPEISLRHGKTSPPIPIYEHLIKDPFIIRYSDGTYSYNNFHIPIKVDSGNFPSDYIEAWDWSSIPTNKESMGKNRDPNCIQYHTFKNIEDQYDFIFNDDGPAEAADLVAIKDLDDKTILLSLIHCKSAVGGRVSADIQNLYGVCGQAQKSIRVKHLGIQRLFLDLKRREELWKSQGCSRLLKGDFRLLSYFKDKSRTSRIKFEVVIVQPGLGKASITSEMLKLLGTTDLYLKKTTEANLRVIGSA